jgi:hypothetical protein
MVAGGQEDGGPDARAAATLHAVGPTSFPQLLIAVAIAGAISMGTFAHADRHGSSHATAWGVGAFLAAGVVVPVYFIRYWLRKRSGDQTP